MGVGPAGLDLSIGAVAVGAVARCIKFCHFSATAPHPTNPTLVVLFPAPLSLVPSPDMADVSPSRRGRTDDASVVDVPSK